MLVYYLNASYNKYIKHVTAYGLHWTALRAAAYVGVITHHDQRLKAGFGTKRNRIAFRSEPKQVVGWLL
jgi:hypothetical protein